MQIFNSTLPPPSVSFLRAHATSQTSVCGAVTATSHCICQIHQPIVDMRQKQGFFGNVDYVIAKNWAQIACKIEQDGKQCLTWQNAR